jgi:hypothetical protein
VTPDQGVRARRFFVAAKQILTSKRKKLRCCIADKLRLDDMIEYVDKSSGSLALSTDLKVEVDMSDFVIKEEFTETRYHVKEVEEEVEEVIIKQEAPMVERVEKTYDSRRTRNVGYSKAQASAHNAIVDRSVIYRQIVALEKLPMTLENRQKINDLLNQDLRRFPGKDFHYEWLSDPKYETKVEKGKTETYIEKRTVTDFLPPVPVETIKVRKKLVKNIVREPYECQTVRYKKLEESKVWRTVGTRKQLEIVHGIFLFEGEPGFAPLRSFIRYRDFNRENAKAKALNEETKNQYLKIKSWEEYNARKKKGKRQKRKNYERHMKFIEGKTPLLEEEFDKVMKELIVPIKPCEVVPLSERYGRVVDAVDSFLCLRDYRRGFSTETAKQRLPSKVVRCLDQIWRHLKHKVSIREIKELDRKYWMPFYKSRKVYPRHRRNSNDSLNEMSHSEYLRYVPEAAFFESDDSDDFEMDYF